MNWFYKEFGLQEGPFSAQELKKLAVQGLIKPDTWVRSDELTDWVRARDVRDLLSNLPAKPPPIVADDVTQHLVQSLAVTAQAPVAPATSNRPIDDPVNDYKHVAEYARLFELLAKLVFALAVLYLAVCVVAVVISLIRRDELLITYWLSALAIGLLMVGPAAILVCIAWLAIAQLLRLQIDLAKDHRQSKNLLRQLLYEMQNSPPSRTPSGENPRH